MKKRKSAPVKAFAHKKVLKKPAPKPNIAKAVLKKATLKKPLKSLATQKKPSKTKAIALKPKAKPTLPLPKKTANIQQQKPVLKKGSLKKPLPKPAPQKSSKANPILPVAKKAVNVQKKKLVLKREAPKKAASTINKAPMPASKKASIQKPNPKTASKKPSSASVHSPAPASPLKEETKNLLLNARKRTATPTIFRPRRKNTPVLFTLDDVKTILQNKSTNPNAHKLTKNPQPLKKPTLAPLPPIPEKKTPAQFFQAASLADILGFNPNSSKALTAFEKEAAKIPPKYKPYYKLLVDLRSHLQQEINLHAQDALKRSGKDETSDNSSYSQHMADAGTDTFDRDFALSILSNEQDALFEIDEAIQRMIQGTYGTCEVTGKLIPKERLMAVPFTRCSIEGQKELEKNKHRSHRTNSVGVFSEVFDDEHGFSDEEAHEV